MHPLDEALTYSMKGDLDKSYNILKQLEIDKTQPDWVLPRVKFNLGMFALKMGDWKQGYDYLNVGRWINVFGSSPLNVGTPIWNGQSNCTVLLRSEAGLGDNIINARFAKNIASYNNKVILSCHKSLCNILSKIDGVTAVVSDDGAKYVHHDYWVPAMSAPGICLNSYEELNGNPYIPRGIYNKDKKMKVGLRWVGNPKFEHEQNRKFDPTPLFNLKNLPIDFYNLQKDTSIPDFLIKSKLNTWDDTLETISQMDLVISSCTSVAHMAAACGVPTWIIIPVLPYYIWCSPPKNDPKKSKWYNNVSLYKQEIFGNWDAPLNNIKNDLEELLYNFNNS